MPTSSSTVTITTTSALLLKLLTAPQILAAVFANSSSAPAGRVTPVQRTKDKQRGSRRHGLRSLRSEVAVQELRLLIYSRGGQDLHRFWQRRLPLTSNQRPICSLMRLRRRKFFEGAAVLIPRAVVTLLSSTRPVLLQRKPELLVLLVALRLFVAQYCGWQLPRTPAPPGESLSPTRVSFSINWRASLSFSPAKCNPSRWDGKSMKSRGGPSRLVLLAWRNSCLAFCCFLWPATRRIVTTGVS